jgi:hypothetical protein
VIRALLAAACVLVCVSADASTVGSSAPARNESPAPPDVRVETKQNESGQWTVTVRRPGYLVALRAGDRTSAGRDFVEADIEGLSGSRIELGWETTDRATLETARGGLRIAAAGDEPHVSWFSLPDPVVAATNHGRLHDCRAFESEPSGFSVVCRVTNGARKLSALNLTGEAPLSGIAAADNAHLVRLDLPVAEGGAEARLIGYLDGSTAVVVRAEATWARGETRPTLSLTAGTRGQLTAPHPLRGRKWGGDFDVLF